MILLPALFLFFNKAELKLSKRVFIFVLPVLLYFIYLFAFMLTNNVIDGSVSIFLNRFKPFTENFENQFRSVESIFSLVSVLFIPLFFVYEKLKELKNENLLFIAFLKAFLLTFIINTFVVLITTKARESRLFVLPLFFLWPVFGHLLINPLKLFFHLNSYKKVFSSWIGILFFVFLNFLSYLVSFKIYSPRVEGQRISFFSEYLFISFFIIIMYVLLKSSKKIEMLHAWK